MSFELLSLFKMGTCHILIWRKMFVISLYVSKLLSFFIFDQFKVTIFGVWVTFNNNFNVLWAIFGFKLRFARDYKINYWTRTRKAILSFESTTIKYQLRKMCQFIAFVFCLVIDPVAVSKKPLYGIHIWNYANWFVLLGWAMNIRLVDAF